MKESEFIKELKEIGININQRQLEQLNIYKEFLKKENKKINLTAIIKDEDIYLKHFYDSLTIVKIINLNKINNLCDLGSGAGFPGVVLKILFPHLEVTLVDSVKKRTDFLNRLVKELKLDKVLIVNERIEKYAHLKREQYDLVVARALAKLNIILELGVSLVKKDKFLVAMKGHCQEEIKKIDKIYNLLKIRLVNKEEFELPNLGGKRTLLKFIKKEATISKYPRSFNKIKVKPL